MMTVQIYAENERFYADWSDITSERTVNPDFFNSPNVMDYFFTLIVSEAEKVGPSNVNSTWPGATMVLMSMPLNLATR